MGASLRFFGYSKPYTNIHVDGRLIQRSALTYKIPLITTIVGATATALRSETMDVKAIQDYRLQMQLFFRFFAEIMGLGSFFMKLIQ